MLKDPLVFKLRCVNTEIPGTTGGRKLLLFFLGTDWMKNNQKRVKVIFWFLLILFSLALTKISQIFY